MKKRWEITVIKKKDVDIATKCYSVKLRNKIKKITNSLQGLDLDLDLDLCSVATKNMIALENLQESSEKQ